MRLARSFLLEHPEACTWSSSGGKSASTQEKGPGGQPHEHGSLRCLMSFLGEANFAKPQVDRKWIKQKAAGLPNSAKPEDVHLSSFVRVEPQLNGVLLENPTEPKNLEILLGSTGFFVDASANLAL